MTDLTLDARELAFVETEAATVATMATAFTTGMNGYLTGWASMALLLYRSHENLATAIKGAGEKKAKPGLPSGYISRLAEYLSGKLDMPVSTTRPYLSALNQLIEKGGKNTDGTLRALCSNADASKIADHWRSKGLRSWAAIAEHARRNSDSGANEKKQPVSERIKRILKEIKPRDIVEGLQAMENSAVIFDLWSKARAKAGKRK